MLHWGEMGSRWGVNRTVGQIHALLYLAEQPMHAEEICETLSIARSNVSTSLKELMDWGLVRVAHVMGDRRDHFEALHDIWDIFPRHRAGPPPPRNRSHVEHDAQYADGPGVLEGKRHHPRTHPTGA